VIALRLFKIYSLLFISSITFAKDVPIHKLTNADIDLATKELVREGRNNIIIRGTVVVAAVALVGFACYKAVPWVGDCTAAANKERTIRSTGEELAKMPAAERSDLMTKVVASDRFKNLDNKDLVTALGAVVVDECNKLKKKGSWFSLTDWREWSGEQLGGLSSVAAMVVMPMVGESLVEKIKDIFGSRNILRLTSRKLEIPQHFQRLQVAQVNWDPNKFLSNSNSQNEKKLRVYAKRISVNFAKTPDAQLAEIKQHARAVFVEECNTLIKNMSYVVSFMKHIAKHAKNQDIINTFADQLHQATYEFGCKVEDLLKVDKIDELFSEAALFQSTFSVTINNYLMFAK
jgi:hypothetical protein